MLKKVIKIAAFSTLAAVSAAFGQSNPGNADMYNNPNPSAQTSPGSSVQMQRGQCFNFAVPAGWRVAEEGQMAVVLGNADGSAITIMTGNCGLPKNSNPVQFMQAKLSAMRIANLRMGQPRRVQAPQGWASVQVDYAYTFNNVPCRGVATCSVREGYDTCDMIMSAAASVESQWASYANWLPQVASSVEATNSNAFGARGVMQQNIQISTNEGERQREYREWSAKKQEEVTRQRAESQDRNNDDFRQTLGNVTRYDNPQSQRKEDLSSNNTVYWVNTVTGQVVGNPNSTYDPRTPTDTNWMRMERSANR